MANTTGVQTVPNCEIAEDQGFTTSATGSILSGSWNGCDFSMNFDNSEASHYGVDVARNCSGSPNFNSLPDPLKPVVFWATTQSPGSSVAALVFCKPKLSLHRVTVEVNLAKGELVNCLSNGDYGEITNVTSGPPLNGQVFNGVGFNATDDPVLQLRANSTRLQLSYSIFHTLSQDIHGLANALADNDRVLNVTVTRYVSDLKLLVTELLM